MTALGYSRWRNFKKIINKTKISCNISNINVKWPFCRRRQNGANRAKNHIKSLLLKNLIRTQHVGVSDRLENKKAISNKIDDKEKM